MTIHIHLDAEPGTPEAGKQLRDACATILRVGNEHYASEKAKHEATKNQRDVAEYLHLQGAKQ